MSKGILGFVMGMCAGGRRWWEVGSEIYGRISNERLAVQTNSSDMYSQGGVGAYHSMATISPHWPFCIAANGGHLQQHCVVNVS
jgi:hypothetical protein